MTTINGVLTMFHILFRERAYMLCFSLIVTNSCNIVDVKVFFITFAISVNQTNTLMNRSIKFIPLVGVAVATASCASVSDTDTVPKPNVIYIIADDLGYGELGCYGQEKIETPNIDALAKSGMRFTQHYSGAPVSGPSRSVLMTGLHLGHTPVRGNNEQAKRGDVWSHEAMLKDSTLEGQAPLPVGTRTVAHLMQDAGYKTGVVGKWGLGYPGSNATPNKMGFDFFYGYNCQRQAHTYYPMFLYKNETRVYLDNAPLLTPGARLKEGEDKYDAKNYEQFARNEYAGDLMFEELMNFVDESKDEPFMLMWTTPIPHVSLQSSQKWVDHYKAKFGEEEPYTGDKGYLPCRYPHATYAAMVSYLDEQVGLLVAKLKADGIYDNTVIMFTSDNGSTFNGGTDSPWFNSNGILKTGRMNGKATVAEGGIRVPLIVSWPNHIKAGTTSDVISAFWDVLPTFADIIDVENTNPTDGISFLPTLTGEEQVEKHDALYWGYCEGTGSRAVRMDNWKGVIYNIKKGNDVMELYNLDNDLHEENDVAAENPDVVKQIKEIMVREHIPATHYPEFNFFED